MTSFNDYSIKKEVGKGAYGTVYLGTRKDTGDEVAMKRIESIKGEGIHFTTIREIKLQLELKHESILPVIL